MKISTVNKSEDEVVKLARNSADPVTAYNVSPHGFESKPVRGAKAVELLSGSNKSCAVGIIHRSVDLKTGESRMFATDLDGNNLSSLYANTNGEFVFNDGVDFAVKFNELKTQFDVLLNSHNALLAEYKLHVHSGVLAGPLNTGTTTSAVPACPADLSSAKVDKVRL